MAEPNGGSVRITGAMLLTALATLVLLWAGWVTNAALDAVKNSETAIHRIDGIVSTLSCTPADPGVRGNRVQGGNGQ